MKALSNMCEKVYLMHRLITLKMGGVSMTNHLNEFNIITTQLNLVDIEFDDEIRALLLLSSLPDSWNGSVTAVISASRTKKLKDDDV